MHIEPTPELNQADLTAIQQAVEVLRAKAPWRKSVSGANTRSLFKLGDSSLSFVEDALNEAKAHEQVLPRAFSIAEMEKRIVFFRALNELLATLNPVFESFNDTATLSGADLMQDALEIYDAIKRAAKKDSALEESARKLGERFKPARRSSKNSAAPVAKP